MFSNYLMCVLKCYCSMADSDLQGSRVSPHLDPNPGITPPLHNVDPELLWEISVWLVTPCSGVDPGIFDWGGSRLWFRKDCRTFLWQITSNTYDHILWYVNPGRHWYWKYCFASRGERIIKGYPKTKYLHFWISLEFSIVRWQNAMHISLKKMIHLKSDTASCRCKNISLKQATGLMGGGGSRPSPGSATVTRIQSASFNGQRPKTTATLHQE